jgi:multiple sugar transport system substrate-binding protein
VSDQAALRGISWDHPRGVGPLRATLAAYAAREPAVRIEWDARSLLRFGEDPLETLAERYDLLVIDHPFVGFGAATGLILPLDTLLPEHDLAALARASVGPSYGSYLWDGHAWALPIDAAAQVSVVRDDLLARAGAALPRSWNEAVALGHALRTHGLAMAIPMIHTDLVPTLFTLATSLGEAPLQEPSSRVLSPDHLHRVLDLLLALRDASHPDSARLDPPSLLDRMATDDDIAYCPLAFGYSNYSRIGFRRVRLRFVDIPSSPSPVGRPGGATLGGAGIAISARCRTPREAANYCLWLASEDTQRGGYFTGGGQPAHRAAWVDPDLNAQTSGFFQGTLATLDHAFLRPRWAGYMVFQDLVGPALHRFVLGESTRHELADDLEAARVETQAARVALETPGG